MAVGQAEVEVRVGAISHSVGLSQDLQQYGALTQPCLITTLNMPQMRLRGGESQGMKKNLEE